MASCTGCGNASPAGARFCNSCGASLEARTSLIAEASGETRKTVTVVFCDVTGSTAMGERLDPESLRRVLARYLAVMQRVIERHGGTVEKFIGDAVMAVFGVPAVHEDDAVRALRAVWEMSESLGSLNEELTRDYGTTLQARIGVDTGEVVTGTQERLATGDTVNVAARLQQSAAPGEILIGEGTLRLAHSAIEVVSVGPLELKGKTRSTPAYRLIGLRADADITRRSEAPMVGRQAELQRLRDALTVAVRDRSCRLFTIVGAAGLGKTRLTRELLSSVDHATVLRGRCLSYGEGITYWPLVEAISPLAHRLPDLGLDPSAAATIETLLSGSGTVSTDEIAWAFRKLVEKIAVPAPVLVLLDDIQWGEDAFLDLVENFAVLSRGAPIFILCLARPDLLDKRSGWAVDVHLEPLPASEAERLFEQCMGGAHIGSEVRVRILASAGGNPLFVEEMTALMQASGGSHISVPPTIQALLAARLDQLDPIERRVLACAGVEGEVFHRGALHVLLPGELSITSRLTALVRKDLIAPHPPQFAGEDGFRFRHLLIRDAAYESMPKAARADLHERLASWLEGKMADRLPEVDAILGYHLEQAYQYRTALGPLDGHSREVGLRAGRLLSSAGNRALARGDAAAAVSLMEHAASVTPLGEPARLRALAQLGTALRARGELHRAIEILDGTIVAASEEGDRAVELRARIERALVDVLTQPEGSENRLVAEAEAAIPELEQLGDDEGLAKAWRAIADFHWGALRFDAAVAALDHSMVHAQRVGDEAQVIENETYRAAGAVLGPTPATAMARLAMETPGGGGADPRREQWRLLLAGCAQSMLGRFDEARDLILRAEAIALPVGSLSERSGPSLYRAYVELLAGDAAAAELHLRRGYELVNRAGDLSTGSTAAAHLALALYEQGSYEEAEGFVDISRTSGASDDVITQVYWRRGLAKILARRGRGDEALDLANDAVALMEPTDALNEHADTLVDLAEVLRLLGRDRDAIKPLERALALYERKENLVSASRVRERLAGLAVLPESV